MVYWPADHSCLVWMESHTKFLGSSPKKICDRWTDKQWRSYPFMLLKLFTAGNTEIILDIQVMLMSNFKYWYFLKGFFHKVWMRPINYLTIKLPGIKGFIFRSVGILFETTSSRTKNHKMNTNINLKTFNYLTHSNKAPMENHFQIINLHDFFISKEKIQHANVFPK